MHSLWAPAFPFWHYALRAGVVYLAVLLLLRLGGKREIGQMGAGEFVALLLISNAVQNSMNGGDNSITGGLFLAVILIGLSALIAYMTFRSKRLEGWIQGHPRVLIHHGEILKENLDRELLSPHELMTLLRRQGIHSPHEVQEAILESDGSLVIVKKSETGML